MSKVLADLKKPTNTTAPPVVAAAPVKAVENVPETVFQLPSGAAADGSTTATAAACADNKTVIASAVDEDGVAVEAKEVEGGWLCL